MKKIKHVIRKPKNLIKQWADKALCYQWMHSRCREIYQRKNKWFTIPVIIISTITGTANFAQYRFPEDLKQYVVMGIGTLSIIAGIVTTISQFLQISELNEGYRASTIAWNKLYNNLKMLVSRHPLDRIPPNQALKLYKDEYDHLCEISPPIIKKVITQFNNRNKKNMDLTKPEICNKLDATSVFSMTDNERQTMIDKINNVKQKNPKLMETFFNINGRDATELETELLQGNLDSTNIEIDMDNDNNDDDNDNNNDKVSNTTITDI